MKNQTKDSKLLWVLTGRGFGSELNNLLYAIYYSKEKGIELRVNSVFWNFTYKKGLSDYFIYTEKNKIRENFVLGIFKSFFNPLTHCYQKTNLIQITKGLFNGPNLFIRESLLSVFFNLMKNLFGINQNMIFENFYRVRKFNLEKRNINRDNYIQQIHEILKEFWVFKSEVLEEIEKINHSILRSIGDEKYAAFHIRRGDKVAESTFEDRVYQAQEYIYMLSNQDKEIKTVFLMTDDYNAIHEFINQYPDFHFVSIADMNDKGHSQDKFNKMGKEEIKKSAIKLFAELEIAKSSDVFIGSRGSNVFRLIEYFKMVNCLDLSGDEDSI